MEIGSRIIKGGTTDLLYRIQHFLESNKNRDAYQCSVSQVDSSHQCILRFKSCILLCLVMCMSVRAPVAIVFAVNEKMRPLIYRQ